MNEIKEYTKKEFEDIKHIDEFGNEFWLGRELQNDKTSKGCEKKCYRL